MRKLTIGMATHDDYDGVYFSIQNIRLNHPEVMKHVEFVIVDNNPTSKHGQAVQQFTTRIKEPIQYLPFTNYQATTVKNKVFALADTPYVLCIDSHVLLKAGTLKALIEYFDSGEDEGNLIQGPLLYDDMVSVSTHFELRWNDYMWGRWETDPRGIRADQKPFEIPAQGTALFSCRKDSWLGFNPGFRGFGCEEGYIHEKYRKHGKKTMCLPFLRWLHRFDRPNGTSYPNDLKTRYLNYLIGFRELGLDTADLKDHFKDVVTPTEMELSESMFGPDGEWLG